MPKRSGTGVTNNSTRYSHRQMHNAILGSTEVLQATAGSSRQRTIRSGHLCAGDPLPKCGLFATDSALKDSGCGLDGESVRRMCGSVAALCEISAINWSECVFVIEE
jgi:hypothetical protein